VRAFLKIKHVLLASVAACIPFIGGIRAFAQTWTQTSAPSTNWTFIASSADGAKLVAIASKQACFGCVGVPVGTIYTSTNSGISWTQTSAPILSWISVASSADGNRLVAIVNSGGIYTSTDSGVTWTQTSAPYAAWNSVASSADGIKLAATVNNGGIYVSTDSGASWTQASAPQESWASIASSADGASEVAGTLNGLIYTSTNSGGSWDQAGTQTNAPFRVMVASSADGSHLLAARVRLALSPTNGSIYTSADSGATWTSNNVPEGGWNSAASSADGTRLAAVQNASIYTSTNSGTTWTSNTAPALNWNSIASSADGGKLVAAVYGGGVYTFRSTPAPVLSVESASNHLALSWLVQHKDFVT